jgi:hypothetical protein
MVEAYVSTASDIERMNDVALFARFDEVSRALSSDDAVIGST